MGLFDKFLVLLGNKKNHFLFCYFAHFHYLCNQINNNQHL